MRQVCCVIQLFITSQFVFSVLRCVSLNSRFITYSLVSGLLIKLNITADNINDKNKSLEGGLEELYGPDVMQVETEDAIHPQKVSITRKMMCSTPKTKS